MKIDKNIGKRVIDACREKSNGTDKELYEDVREDFYKNHQKIEIPICFYTDKDGNKVYDYESMAEEFENELSKITGATVMCSVSEDIIYED